MPDKGIQIQSLFPVLLQLGDARGTGLDNLADGLLVAKPGACVKRVRDMLLEGVVGVHHARDATLRVVAVAVGGLLFGHKQDAPAGFGEVYGAHKPRNAASGNEEVAVYCPHFLHGTAPKVNLIMLPHY